MVLKLTQTPRHFGSLLTANSKGDILMVKPYWEGNHGVEPGSYFGIEPNLSNLLFSSDCLYRLPDRHLVAKMFKELSLL